MKKKTLISIISGCIGIITAGSISITAIVKEKEYDMSEVTFNSSSFTYDGNAHSIYLEGDLPEGLEVEYINNNKIDVGEYEVTANFIEEKKYKEVDNMSATMSIVKSSISGISFVGKSVTYTGDEYYLEISGTLPSGVEVTYSNNNQTEAGTYEVIASFTDTTGNYNDLPDMKATLTINKATYDMSSVYFNSKTVLYDGKEHTLEIEGNLPKGVSVSYTDNKMINAGSLEVIASFSHNNPNYNEIPDMKATLTVVKDGSYHDVIFIFDDGTTIKKVVKDGDLLIDIPSIPNKEGYTRNWSYNFNNAINGDINVYIIDNPNTYVITYITNGGLLDEYTQEVTFNSDFELKIPTRDGYTFVSWMYEDSVFENGKYLIADNIVISAKWEANTYKLNYYYDDELIYQDNVLYDGNYMVLEYVENDKNIYYIESIEYNGITYNALEEFKYITLGDYNINIKVKLIASKEYEYAISLFDDEVTITGYLGNDIKLIIPEYVVGEEKQYYKVSSIGKNAFSSCNGLISLVIPDSVGIDSSAFSNCSSLTYIKLPDTLIRINESVFSNCSSLTSLVIPNSVTSIGSSAFYNCSSLTSIELPSTLTSIGSSVFEDCSSLTSIVIPEGVTTIRSSVFLNCSSLTSVVILEGVTSIGEFAFAGCNSLISVELPCTLTSISSSAFENCSSLTNIVIPEGVTSIGRGALYGCSNLTSITLPFVGRDNKHFGYIFAYSYGSYSKSVPKSLKTVVITKYVSSNSSVFSYCSSLISVKLPDTLISLGDYAFHECSSLESIIIPEGVTSIGKFAFAGCNSLTSVELPSTLISIGSSAFENCTSLTNIVIPEGVTSIGLGALYGCSNLTSITLPFVGDGNSITYFRHIFGAKSKDSYLDSNYTKFVPKSLKTVVISKSISIDELAFIYCGSLTSIVILEGVTSIGESAFTGCYSLTSVELPSTLISIGSGAFKNCTSLTSIVIPEGVTSIGEFTFSGCNNLRSIILPNSLEYLYWNLDENLFKSSILPQVNEEGYIGKVFFGKKDTTYNGILEIKEGTTQIYSYALENQNYITELIIPESVKYFPKNALIGCSSLQRIIMPACLLENSTFGTIFGTSSYTGGVKTKQNGTTYYVPSSLREIEILGEGSINSHYFQNCSNIVSIIAEDILSIGNYAFKGCKNLSVLELGDKYSSIGNEAFQNCVNLREMILSDNLTSVGGYIFSGCSGLTTVTLGNGLQSVPSTMFSNATGLKEVKFGNQKTIESSAFKNNTSLTTITLSDTIESIGDEAFSGCTQLTKIVIPNSVTSIGTSAFKGCTSLTLITLSNNLEKINRSLFEGCTGLTSIVIPGSVKEVESRAFYNCTGLTNVNLGSGVVTLGDYAFYNCYNLLTLKLSDNLNTIGTHVFYKCSSLSSLVLPQYVTTVGAYAFYGCTGITSLTLSDNLNSIGESAFEGCSKFTAFKLPDSVTNIGNRAFYGCSSLTAITFGSNLETIGNYAFANCKSLSNILIPTNIISIGDYAFNNCAKLVTVTIGDSIVTLGDYAFVGCTNLTNVRLGKSIKNIGDYAFKGCSKLANINIGECIEQIGAHAFEDCSSLTSIDVTNAKVIGIYAFKNCTSLTNVLLGQLTEIAEGTFYNCSSLVNIIIPNSVSAIGVRAFYNCNNLSNVTFGENLNDIASEAFYNCDGLDSLEFNYFINLGEKSFAECNGLINVIFNGEVIVGQQAFYGCNNLANVYFYGGGIIGVNSFNNLQGLERVYIGEGVTSIGASAFYNCDNLKTIELPESLINIGENAFEDCDRLESVIFGNELAVISSNLFNSCDKLEYVELGNNINTISSSAFKNCVSLEEVVIKDNLIVISDNAFYNCISLKELILPESLITIGVDAFYNLSSLEKIVIPSQISAISSGLLYGASNLKVLVVPFVGTDQYATIANANTLLGVIFGTKEYDNSNAVTQYYSETGSVTYYFPNNLERVEITNATNIFYGSFSNITTLKEVIINKQVTNIGSSIFSGASNLELVYYRGLETEWNLVTKDEGYNNNASDYELRFISDNLVRVTLFDTLNNHLACNATLYDETGLNIKYEGISTYYGQVLENVSNGTYLLKVTYENYVKEEIINVDGDEEYVYISSELNILEQFQDREMIVVLTWGENPRDLDSHMIYNDGASSYHVYYANQIDTETGTNLDIDDRYSFGPEVITVLELQEGSYKYCVYDYTNSGMNTSNGIQISEAHVAVYIDGILVASYDAPTSGQGCLWTVFEYNGTTNEIITINEMSGGMSSSQVA